MESYKLGRHHEVQQGTKNRHDLTWTKFVRVIEAAGFSGASEETLRNICSADKNSGFFGYCLRSGWIVPIRGSSSPTGSTSSAVRVSSAPPHRLDPPLGNRELGSSIAVDHASHPRSPDSSMTETGTTDEDTASTTVPPSEFARVISCSACPPTVGSLLRDSEENVPQPGWVGARYPGNRVLLVGQNPGVPPADLQAADREYTRALRSVRDAPGEETLAHLSAVLLQFVPTWPIHGRYFPLEECGLVLDEIAYFNLVRCRTSSNAAPSASITDACLDRHFGRWLDLLRPRVVVFLGKWAFDRAREEIERRGLPCGFINRDRSLPGPERDENRAQVVALVTTALGQTHRAAQVQ